MAGDDLVRIECLRPNASLIFRFAEGKRRNFSRPRHRFLGPKSMLRASIKASLKNIKSALFKESSEAFPSDLFFGRLRSARNKDHKLPFQPTRPDLLN